MNWIIENETDSELAWSNSIGWAVDDYDTFTDEEKNTMSLPMDGVWRQVPWSIA